jgi:hypothetical protein
MAREEAQLAGLGRVFEQRNGSCDLSYAVCTTEHTSSKGKIKRNIELL